MFVRVSVAVACVVCVVSWSCTGDLLRVQFLPTNGKSDRGCPNTFRSSLNNNCLEKINYLRREGRVVTPTRELTICVAPVGAPRLEHKRAEEEKMFWLTRTR